MQHEHALQPRATADANAALHLTQSCCNARSLAWVLIGTQDPSFTKRREQKDRHGTCKTAEQSTHAAHREREERATKRDPAANAQKGGKDVQRHLRQAFGRPCALSFAAEPRGDGGVASARP